MQVCLGQPVRRGFKFVARFASVAVALIVLGAALPALAQEGDRPARPDRGQRPDATPRRPQPPGPPGSGPAAGPGDLLPAGPMWRPGPDDFGPLRPGEREQLMDFARREMPGLFRLLRRFEQQDPNAFEVRFQRGAPRLRFLRRMFERDVQLARDTIRHSEKFQELRRAGEAFRDNAGNAARQRRARVEAQRSAADLVQLKIKVLEARAAWWSRHRDFDLDKAIRLMTAPGAPLAAHPPDLRRKIEAVRKAPDDSARETARADLRSALLERVDDQIAAFREQAAALRADAAREADRLAQESLDADAFMAAPDDRLEPPEPQPRPPAKP